MAASLFVILARNARDAVIFRRGPSKQVLLIKWDRKKDTFKNGQWFKGRIFERRCDLSPSGRFLVYLAAKHKGPIQTWTAVSKPPYLTALALWPNMGTWGGGGLFEGESSLLLHNDAGLIRLADGFSLPASMMVRPLGCSVGSEEYDSIYHVRLLRDGWILKQKGEQQEHRTTKALSWRFAPARIYEKAISRKKGTHLLQMQLHGVADNKPNWYALDHEVFSGEGESLLKLPRIGWADWDDNGDLLFADGGKLFRLPWSNRDEYRRDAAEELADFSDLTFTPNEPPKRALSWEPWR
jgi:hypothetical protein